MERSFIQLCDPYNWFINFLKILTGILNPYHCFFSDLLTYFSFLFIHKFIFLNFNFSRSSWQTHNPYLTPIIPCICIQVIISGLTSSQWKELWWMETYDEDSTVGEEQVLFGRRSFETTSWYFYRLKLLALFAEVSVTCWESVGAKFDVVMVRGSSAIYVGFLTWFEESSLMFFSGSYWLLYSHWFHWPLY